MMRGHSVLQVSAVLLHYSPLIDISLRTTDEIRHFTGKITSLISKLPISIFLISKRGEIDIFHSHWQTLANIGQEIGDS